MRPRVTTDALRTAPLLADAYPPHVRYAPAVYALAGLVVWVVGCARFGVSPDYRATALVLIAALIGFCAALADLAWAYATRQGAAHLGSLAATPGKTEAPTHPAWTAAETSKVDASRAILGAHATLALAADHCRKLAGHIGRAVAVHIGFAQQPVAYITVAPGQRCPCCDQVVPVLATDTTVWATREDASVSAKVQADMAGQDLDAGAARRA